MLNGETRPLLHLSLIHGSSYSFHLPVAPNLLLTRSKLYSFWLQDSCSDQNCQGLSLHLLDSNEDKENSGIPTHWELPSGNWVHFSCHELKTGGRHVRGWNHFYYTCIFANYQIFRNKSLEDVGEERRKKNPSFCLLTPPVDEKIAMTVF